MKEFNEDQYVQFARYINELHGLQRDSPKPFACEQLIILPEDVVYGNGRRIKIEKGATVCRFGAAKGIGGARCSINSDLKMGKDGLFEVLCEQTGSKFKAKLQGFSYQKPFIF